MTKSRRFAGLLLALSLLIPAPLAAEPASKSEALLRAVKSGEDARVVEAVKSGGPGAINTRGYDGSTALITATSLKRLTHVNFLLQNKADPNLAQRDGDTPLIVATRLYWVDGVAALLGAKANVDGTNRHGETALIIAVHNRNPQLVRRLLEAGANADKTDNAAGMSARDYARRDTRVREISRLIDTVKPLGAAKP
jgi:ankyrin repeat protein